jgi:hypothetical protein
LIVKLRSIASPSNARSIGPQIKGVRGENLLDIDLILMSNT